ncbi:hypothetical protein LCGC14_0759670 [marine sediment metagenome]|uniref:Uncharacterized protein n=1 Tax=marine sediment metagenome TaxID=412755 RepID=A0A0F9T8P0_9ZZZZ
MPSLTLLPRSKAVTWPDKGEWIKITHEGKVTARLACPGCGTISSMYEHDISPEGNVTPSVDCSNDCGYHEVGVVLAGWSDG